MIVYGLIGYPLEHSGSAMLFREIFKTENLYDRDYRLFPIKTPEMVRSLVNSHPGIAGLNVTLPFKETIIPFLDELDQEALEIGAVNTIKITRIQNRAILTGYNTDADGFALSGHFQDYGSALILGSGGAARAVAYALRKAGKTVLFVSRTRKTHGMISYPEINETVLNKFRLIINATPSGMFPDVKSSPPIPYKLLTGGHFLYDLVYNPEISVFLKKGKDKGCRVQNGMEMLKQQAILSYQIWAGI
jgi:shikimate dehydrogenase